ncbi:Velvet complex subunit B [Mycena venus]|uniref:Velvet complex subunit B n=1 Tax=Mycena venus TaxID=2733690 RepID=A0A8H6Y6F5_9AGAR|nr:Velvet complex subunit B [Mycena venus]
MIQHINPRKTATAIAPMRQSAVDGPEQWGKWVGRNYYSLEMVQHPLRARMCGFGDKDRRPLAPAAVARMVVKRDDHSVVDVDDVDCSFFIVTVDLWSEDGKHERNLVLHPSSGERYVPVQTTKQRRRGGSATGPPRSGHQTPISRSTPTPFRPAGADSGSGPGYSGNQGGYFPAPQSPMSGPVSFAPSSPYGPPSQPPTWGYPSHSSQSSPQVDRNTTYPPPILPSIHSFGRSSSVSSPVAEPWSADPEPTYRPWNADNNNSSSFGHADHYNPPALKSGSEPRDGHTPWGEPNRYSQDSTSYASSPTPTPQQYDPALYAASSPYSHPPQSQQQQVQYFSPSSASNNNSGSGYPQQSAPSGSAILPAPSPRNAYTRTLVGPLSSNGYRLLDEHRKPGIFFLFQDLSVRTEGTFRLRLRLMNVGAPPAPEPGALQVHTSVSPVLAQIFTEPFTVFSGETIPWCSGNDRTVDCLWESRAEVAAGKIPSPLPHFGALTSNSQRNRHGSSKRRRDDSGSDDDSDGG